MALKKRKPKKPSRKSGEKRVCGNESWTIMYGTLTRSRGRPEKAEPLFKAVGEKIPYEFLNQVKAELKNRNIPRTGVYIAHDSMGYPRYIGRGDVFGRLEARRKAQVLELRYFSFFIVEYVVHEREIETIMMRAAGPLLDFNERKVRTDIAAGDVRDFEPGTQYVERQFKKGRKKTKRAVA